MQGITYVTWIDFPSHRSDTHVYICVYCMKFKNVAQKCSAGTYFHQHTFFIVTISLMDLRNGLENKNTKTNIMISLGNESQIVCLTSIFFLEKNFHWLLPCKQSSQTWYLKSTLSLCVCCYPIWNSTSEISIDHHFFPSLVVM